jgi:two-component system NtrC family sensor kinase
LRIALKITLALTLWTVGVLAVMSERELEHEFEIIDRDLAEALVLMGQALQPFVEDAWQRGGREQVTRVLDAAYARERTVNLRWIDPDELARGLGEEQLTQAAMWAVERSAPEVLRWPDEDVDEPVALYAHLPISTGEPRDSVLELRRSLDVREELRVRSRRQLWVTIFVIGTCAAVLAVGIGWLLVGQRVGRLSALARAVGRGETTKRVPATANDELTELTSALNDMVQDLEDTRARGARAAAERERLTNELRHADRLATIGALMARLAHEIGTPLNVIAARTKLIAREQVEGTAVVENARIAAEQTDRITTIIRTFLDFARDSRDAARRFPATAIVEHTTALLGSLALERNVELVVGTRVDDRFVNGDLLLLQQAVTNLVVNALDVAPPGSRVTIDVTELDCTPPDGRGRGPGRYLCVRVGDRGPGIDPDVLPHLFEAFFTTKPRGGGTGLGLSIAAGIVHEHGGWIDVESDPQVGTQFMLHLPLDADA